MPQYFHLKNEENLQEFIIHCRRRHEAGERDICVEFSKAENHKTDTLKRCMWQWLTDISIALNDAGFDLVIESKVLKEPVHVPWSKDSMKLYIWNPVQKVVSGHTSSKELNTKEFKEIENIIARHLGMNYGIKVPPWPSMENRGEES